jgi:hypothetical protein
VLGGLRETLSWWVDVLRYMCYADTTRMSTIVSMARKTCNLSCFPIVGFVFTFEVSQLKYDAEWLDYSNYAS